MSLKGLGQKRTGSIRIAIPLYGIRRTVPCMMHCEANRTEIEISSRGIAMNEPWRSRITIEPGKRGGRPCIRSMRISVYDVLSYLAAGMSSAQILEDFPYLEPEDIQASLAYAAERERRMQLSGS